MSPRILAQTARLAGSSLLRFQILSSGLSLNSDSQAANRYE